MALALTYQCGHRTLRVRISPSQWISGLQFKRSASKVLPERGSPSMMNVPLGDFRQKKSRLPQLAPLETRLR